MELKILNANRLNEIPFLHKQSVPLATGFLAFKPQKINFFFNKFYSLQRKMPPYEGWCGKCHTKLPPHKHQLDRSCLVLRADGTVCKFNVACWNGVGASELFAFTGSDEEALKLKRQMCEAGVVQCGSCIPFCPPFLENCCKRNCHTKLSAEEADSCLMQKSDQIVDELRKLKFSSSSSEDEDWCRKCKPSLPPHKHQGDGSYLVKTTDGTEEFYGFTLERADGTQSKMSAFAVFQKTPAAWLAHPVANMAALKTKILNSQLASSSSFTGVWFDGGHLPPVYSYFFTEY